MTRTQGNPRHEMTGQRGFQSGSASDTERAQRIFHELHGDGHHALCSICEC
jgi:hypothetical protein